jgi:hypothetical protein
MWRKSVQLSLGELACINPEQLLRAERGRVNVVEVVYLPIMTGRVV